VPFWKTIWFGTAVLTDQQELKTFSDNYTGLLDEFTFWNSARTKEQFLRDQYSEINREQLIGVLCTFK
jgi:hypothetical protein